MQRRDLNVSFNRNMHTPSESTGTLPCAQNLAVDLKYQPVFDIEKYTWAITNCDKGSKVRYHASLIKITCYFVACVPKSCIEFLK